MVITMLIYMTLVPSANKAPSNDKILWPRGFIRCTAARTRYANGQILKTIKNMDKLETYFKVDTSYVADVQKGLLALSDIIEYQKEIKRQRWEYYPRKIDLV